MVSIARATRTVKEQLNQLLVDHVLEALTQTPLTWRDRLLNPVLLVELFAMQILHGNTAINHLRHLSGLWFTAQAYCQARQRLPLELLQRVSGAIARRLIEETRDAGLWLNHRVWKIDGSSFSMPDTPSLQAHFGQHSGQKPGCGFPTAALLMLTHALGFVVRTIAAPLRTHDMRYAALMHEELAEGDVLVADRGFCSYAHLGLILQRKLHAIFRMHQKQIVSFRSGRPHQSRQRRSSRRGVPRSQWLRKLGPCDQLVRWFKPKQRPRWMSAAAYAALPESLVVRELRYQVRIPGQRVQTVTLVTTLLDAQRYPAAELAEQYRARWEIETQLGALKTTMGMDVLKCQTVDGVLKELAMFTLVYNLVRLVMLRAAQRQQAPVDRISFIDALRWLCDARDAYEVATLIVNISRPGRVEPRATKRRPKPFPNLTKPRAEARKDLLKKAVMA